MGIPVATREYNDVPAPRWAWRDGHNILGPVSRELQTVANATERRGAGVGVWGEWGGKRGREVRRGRRAERGRPGRQAGSVWACGELQTVQSSKQFSGVPLPVSGPLDKALECSPVPSP